MGDDFSILIKPASSVCDMRCEYCFYADISGNRSVKSYGVMKRETMEALIQRVMERADRSGSVHFAFQGGEPLLAGLSFFEDFTSYAQSLKPERVKITYSVQTNGLGIDTGFCELFKRYDFLVGLSFDGTPQIHDYLRRDSTGAGTAKRVLAMAGLLKQYGIDFNILSVVTKQVARHPRKIFTFLRKYGFDYIQFIPCLAPLEGESDGQAYSLTPRLYGEFLKTMFDCWYDDFTQGRYISIRLFDNITRMYQGYSPEQCGMLGFCQPQFVIEADGGVYPCDFYVLDKWRAGSIIEKNFHELAESGGMRAFLNEKSNRGPLCDSCGFLKICGGGCKRCRSLFYGEQGYCPYQDFLYYSNKRFMALAGQLNRISNKERRI